MQNRKFNVPLAIGVGLVLLGSLMRIQHWNFSKDVFSLGILTFVVSFTLRFFAKKEKSWIDFTGLALVTVWCTLAAMRLYKLPYTKEFTYLLFLIGFVYLLQRAMDFLKKGKSQSTSKFNIDSILLFVGVLLLLGGTFFKLQHWPGAHVLLIAGIVVTGAWFLRQF